MECGVRGYMKGCKTIGGWHLLHQERGVGRKYPIEFTGFQVCQEGDSVGGEVPNGSRVSCLSEFFFLVLLWAC